MDASADPSAGLPAFDPNEGLEALKDKIQEERGFNSHFYKDKCLRRRLEVRMRARGVASFEEYSRLLDVDATEYDRLIETLTVNVTRFFRNRSTWDLLERTVLPALVERPGPIRVWSGGCASGEEAYSVALLIHEIAGRAGRKLEPGKIDILGTDIDRRSLMRAEAGRYPATAFDETDPAIRQRWFTDGDPARLDDSIREGVRFALADITTAEPPLEVDLLLCRNVIIYFERTVQEALFDTFYRSLRPGGTLVLGRVETLIGEPRSLFKPLHARERIYRRRD